jgi:hypothetical protein
VKSHTTPFENRWTSGERAWQWNCELDRVGVANVRALFAEHESHHDPESTLILDIPGGYVQDWLTFQDRRAARYQMLWRASILVLALAAVTAAMLGVMR